MADLRRKSKVVNYPKEIPLIRFSYNTRGYERHFVDMYSGGVNQATPPVVVFELGKVDTTRVHAAEFCVITVPDGYAVDEANDDSIQLYDPADNPCKVTCEDMRTEEFQVSSPLGTFTTRMIPEYAMTTSSRNEHGKLWWSVPVAFDFIEQIGEYRLACGDYGDAEVLQNAAKLSRGGAPETAAPRRESAHPQAGMSISSRSCPYC